MVGVIGWVRDGGDQERAEAKARGRVGVRKREKRLPGLYMWIRYEQSEMAGYLLDWRPCRRGYPLPRRWQRM